MKKITVTFIRTLEDIEIILPVWEKLLRYAYFDIIYYLSVIVAQNGLVNPYIFVLKQIKRPV
ncbi:MAG: hypothetical protein JSW63_10975 [Ignavibacterium sp.]|nr:MAG: hypothetical protein JSW63_10975 [Ignavibacterium sp.]